MSTQSILESKLAESFDCSHLEVINESCNHNVPVGSESHFKIVMVSTDFEGDFKVARHQKIYEVLDQEMKNLIHALALHTMTPAEWKKKNGEVPMSPPCGG